MPLDLDEAAPAAKAEGVGAPEVEITPEMIEAGVTAYYAVDMRVSDIEFLVQDVFEAMWSALHK